jgi:uncharacterized protein YceK
MKKILFALIVAALLSGCARTMWIKADATQEEFLRDRYECERDMRQTFRTEGLDLGDSMTAAFNGQYFFRSCMESKGYTLTRADGK